VYGVLIILTSLSRLCNLFFLHTYAEKLGSSIATKVYSNTLNQEFIKLSSQASSSLVNLLTTHLDRTIRGIYASFSVLYSLLFVLFISSSLLVVNARLFVGLILLFSAVYLVIIFYTRLLLSSNSLAHKKASFYRTQIASESLNSARLLVLHHLHDKFIRQFSSNDSTIRRVEKINAFITESPRFIIEPLGLLSLLLYSFFLVNISQSNSIPSVVGTFALGLLRILPSFQQIFNGWATVNGYSSDIQTVLYYLQIASTRPLLPFDMPSRSLSWDTLSLHNISFSHSKNSKNIITDFSYTFKKGSKTAIVGPSGSGKTTLIDLISGLITPCSGHISLDGIDIHSDSAFLQSWQHSLTIATQQPFIMNDTLLANISLLSYDEPDLDLARSSLLSVNLSNSNIESRLLSHELLGEFGSTLSGGQRQRLALSRIYYSPRSLVILDEPTSALDYSNAIDVITNFFHMFPSSTFIVVTHDCRIASLCDSTISTF